MVLFASGNGSNVERLVRHFSEVENVDVSGIICNKPGAFVLERARNLNIPSRLITREEFYHPDFYQSLAGWAPDWIILAGFLWLIPEHFIKAFPSRIINIHPALLPKYGGKGMYGMKVHQAVIDAKDRKSGISIHRVNEEYDRGEILFQAECEVYENETPESLAQKIHQLEYEYFPHIIEMIIRETN